MLCGHKLLGNWTGVHTYEHMEEVEQDDWLVMASVEQPHQEGGHQGVDNTAG